MNERITYDVTDRDDCIKVIMMNIIVSMQGCVTC